MVGACSVLLKIDRGEGSESSSVYNTLTASFCSPAVGDPDEAAEKTDRTGSRDVQQGRRPAMLERLILI